MKKILLISYHFPPDIAVGSLRTAKFVKYLRNYGWEPYVLTVKDRYREKLDQKRVKDIKDIKVYKTIELPRIRNFYLISKKALSGLRQKKRSIDEKIENSFVGIELDINQRKQESIKKKLKRYFVSLFLSLPDDKINWIIPAVVKAVCEIKRQKIGYIMTSSPPHSTDLIGLLVQKIANVKWVADFRDPWIDILKYSFPIQKCMLSEKIERWMEKQVIHNADRIVINTGHFKKALLERYKSEPEAKFLYIPNGIDAEKFNFNDDPPKYEDFTITYTGSLYFYRNPGPLFEAIKDLASENKIDLSHIRVKLIGNCRFIDDKPTIKVVQSYGLDNVVEILDQVPYEDVLIITRRSHLLLLLAPPQHHLMVPAKVYDYMGSGTKILALTGNGATSEIVRETGTGESFFPSDVQGISEYIYKLYKQVKNGNASMLINDKKCYSQFEVKLLTKRLAGHLSTI